MSATRNSNLINKPADALAAIKIICNGLKKTSNLSVACVLAGSDAQEISNQVDYITSEIIRKLGLSSQDQTSMNVLSAIVSEPVANTLASAAFMGASGKEIKSLSDALVETMTSLARSKSITNHLNLRYASEIDATIALRMTSSAALIPAATEISFFDFGLTPKKCMEEASKQILSASFDAAEFLSAQHSSVAAKVMLTQSLLNSSGKLYAACYRSYAEKTMDIPAPDKLITAKDPRKASDVLAPIAENFYNLFELCVNAEFPSPSPIENKQKPNKPKI